MSAFDLPPSTPPVSFEPPPNSSGRSRRRTAAVAVASAGLVAAGVLVVTQFASADEAEPVARSSSVGTESVGSTPPPAPTSTTQPDDADTDVETNVDVQTDVDGKIVIRVNDEEPIVIDLGELGEVGELGDLPTDLGELDVGELGDIGRIKDCLGIDDRIEHPPLGGFDVFGDDEDVTLAGPDGVSVLDFGDGDGSVTITRSNGELTVTSEGDVEVKDLSDVFDDLPLFEPGESADASVPPLPDFQELIDCLHAPE